MKTLFAWLTVVFTLLSAGGCKHDVVAEAPMVLRFSAIPDQDPELVKAQHEPVIRQVCALAGLRCEFVATPSYEALVARIGSGEIDFAYLGGVTFVQALHRHEVEPLVMRDIDANFTSIVVVRADAPARTLTDIKGRKFAFGNRMSTSGHFMARHMLEKTMGVVPERYFSSIEYANNHTGTMELITSGKADGGAINAYIYYRALREDDPLAKGLRVIWQSPPYIDYVWAARRTLPADLRERVLAGFLDLDVSLPAHRQALDAQSAVGYVPAYREDFLDVLEVVRRRGAL